MSRECTVCGLATVDLPEGVYPDEAFTATDGIVHCWGCEPPAQFWTCPDCGKESEDGEPETHLCWAGGSGS